jgi:glycolate oxidase iron-sulfur subunit
VVDPEQLRTCVHCGLCLASCPTYVELGTETDSPRGRIYLMRGLEEGTLAPTPEVIRHLDGCLGCRACETACPSGVPYGALIEATRPFLQQARPATSRLGRRTLGAILGVRSLRQVAFAPMRLVAGSRWLRRMAPRLPGLWAAYAAALPRARRPHPLPPVLEPIGPARGTAVLLTGCVADTLFSDTNAATAALLQKAGVRVVVSARDVCCGALAMHLGLGEGARTRARRAAAALAIPEADWVVTNAAGCGALLKEYAHVLPDDTAAATVAGKARDALELLADLGLPPPSGALPRTVAVHDPCHAAHGQGVRTPARRLLATIPELRLVDLEESDWCCGSAGTYNLTERAMARRLLDRKLDRIATSGAQVVAAANPGCLLQIRAGAIARGLAVDVEHPIDLFARAHGL